MRRGWVILGAALIQTSLGALYAWSAFTRELGAAPFHFSATQTQTIFSLGLATFALATILGGRCQTALGPQRCALIGGALFAAGYVLAWAAGSSFVGQLLSLGIVAGLGLGLTYVVPIAVGVKWFPDRKGLITGVTVAGFGFGALLWVQLASSWTLGAVHWVGLIERVGVSTTYLILGCTFLTFILLGARVMVNPPDGWQPRGAAPKTNYRRQAAAVEFGPRAMLATWQFRVLWIMYACGALAGLMVIGIIKLFGTDTLQLHAGLSEAQAESWAAIAMGLCFAAGNGCGRLAWGGLSDWSGPKAALILLLSSQGALLLGFYYAGGAVIPLLGGAFGIGFNFGGTLSLFPVITASYFGSAQLGRNYGWMYTAYGVGGVAGPLMAGLFRDAARDAITRATNPGDALRAAFAAWGWPFFVASGACFVAAVLALWLRTPAAQVAAPTRHAPEYAASPLGT